MTGEFRISIDRPRHLLRIDLGGFFELQDIPSYLAEKRAALARLGCGRNDHVTLCDVSRCGIQSQAVMHAFKASLEDPAHMSRRLAIVVGNTLAKLQVQRILTRSDAQCFDNMPEAKKWLFAA